MEAKACYNLPDVRNRMIDRFGTEIYDSNNNLVTSLLSSIIFTDQEALAFVEQMIHPLVHTNYLQWLKKRSNKPYTLYEAAILFEKNRENYFDKVIYVYAPVELRMERLITRDHTDRNLLQRRMNKQWDDDRKMKLADFIIYNQDIQTLPQQVEKIHFEIVG
jgi:dephospho-CoA kinase